MSIAQFRRKSFTRRTASGATWKPAFSASTRKCAAQSDTSRFHGGVLQSGHITKSFERIIETTRAMPASTTFFASPATEVSSTGNEFKTPPAATSGNTRETVCSRQP